MRRRPERTHGTSAPTKTLRERLSAIVAPTRTHNIANASFYFAPVRKFNGDASARSGFGACVCRAARAWLRSAGMASGRRGLGCFPGLSGARTGPRWSACHQRRRLSVHAQGVPYIDQLIRKQERQLRTATSRCALAFVRVECARVRAEVRLVDTRWRPRPSAARRRCGPTPPPTSRRCAAGTATSSGARTTIHWARPRRRPKPPRRGRVTLM